MTLLIKNAQIFWKGNLVRKNIFIENGKIRKIITNEVKADEVIDAKDKIILPGLIDPHVHFREPGLTHKEDFFTGSCAAAAGGITTFLDMPNTKPETINVERLEEKRRLAKKSIVNFGFHFGGSKDDNVEEIKNVKGIASVKVFMNESTGKMLVEDEEILKKIFENSRLVIVHAENEMVAKAIQLSKECGNKLYLAHISSKSEIEVIQENKDSNIFVEVSPHHLFLTEQDKERLGSFAEMKPGLKTQEDQNALWEAINNNIVSTIGTDHAPHTAEEKHEINYPYGVPGCDTMLPLMLNAVNDERISLKKLVQLCCENPARIFKLKGKGFIEEGFDADLTIVDMNLEKEVINEEMFTKCKWSPFNGMMLKGWPIKTIVNGNIVFENGIINNIRGKEVEYN